MSFTPAEALSRQTDLPVSTVENKQQNSLELALGGPKCSREPGPGCFLDSEERRNLADEFRGALGAVQINVNTAISKVAFQRLIRKEEDLDWVTDLLLSALSMGIASCLVAGAKLAKGAIEEHVTRAAAAIRIGGGDTATSLATNAARALEAATPARMASAVGLLVSQGKAAVANEAKGTTEHQVADQKSVADKYLEHVRNSYNLGFQNIRRSAPALMNDVELIQLVHALDTERHTAEKYTEVLSEQLRRFENAGIDKIGRKNATRDISARLPGLMGHAQALTSPKHNVVRDTRLVWRAYVSGYPRELVYEFHDGEESVNIDEARRLAEGKHPTKFGPRIPVTDRPEIGNVVPREFEAFAVQRHVEVWGEVPRTEMVDDSNSFDPMRVAAAVRNKNAAKRERNSSWFADRNDKDGDQ